MCKSNEVGIITIDAALGLLMSVFLFFSIATTAFTIKTEAYLQQILFNTTKEAAQYTYILSKTKQNDTDTMISDVVNGALVFFNGIQQGKIQLEQLQTFDYEKVELVDVNADNIFNALLNVKDNRYLMQEVAKYLFKKYIPGNNDNAKNHYLKNMGVLGGLDGITFAGTWLHTKQRDSQVSAHNMYLTVEIAYRLRGMYYHQFDYHHTIKSSVTLKIRTGDS